MATKKSEERLYNIRHSLAHMLASAVLERFPKAKLGVGPVIETGFYYDFQLPRPLTPDDLKIIEKRMRDLSKQNLEFKRTEHSFSDAVTFFKELKQDFKVELVNDIEKFGTTKADEILAQTGPKSSDSPDKVSLYQTGNFTDLCRGGHVTNTKEIPLDGFKLDKVSGAYWRGDEGNPQMQRIYGLAFLTKEELEHHLFLQEEAKKRDHRKLGKELGLFALSDRIGAGLPLIQPKGMIIRKQIEDFLWSLHEDKGYYRVWTPHIAKEDLYITSGHSAKFGDELFKVQGKDEKFILKPMNCPHHMQIFSEEHLSYRDLPVRYFEPATVYRDEKSGQLSGLTRVRSITQDDGHLFCRIDQIEEEVSTIVEIITTFYQTIGMLENYWVSLSVRGEDQSKYIGSESNWNLAEKTLEKAAKLCKLPYKRIQGEAAFYGPKLDFMFKDALGREWQLATVQCDFNLPERFDLSFINAKGEKERPVVVHRAITGSLERFMGILIEQFAGHFPLWLAPVQIKLLTLTEKEEKFANQVLSKLKKEIPGLRIELDTRNESIGKKIREATLMKIPYLGIIGAEERKAKTVSIRTKNKDLGSLTLEKLITKIQKEISKKLLQ